MGAETKAFRVGLIGAGLISEFHIRALLRVPTARIVGITDLEPARAKGMAERFGLRTAPSVEALAADGLDVIHVMTPPQSHADLTLKALGLGAHVFVEKPLATSVEDCDRIAEAAKSAGKSVGVNHSLLFDPMVDRVLRLVRRGAIGNVLAVDYAKSQAYPSWRDGPVPVWLREGGYPFRDVGVHALYLIQELLGEIADVRAVFRPGPDRNLRFSEWRAIVESPGGTGQIHLSWNVRPMQHVLKVQGTRGVIRADLFGMTVGVRKVRPLPEFVNRAVNAGAEGAFATVQVPANLAQVAFKRFRRFHGVQAMVADFYSRLAAGAPPRVTPAQAKPIVGWTERIARQADAAQEAFLARFPRTLTAPVLVTGANGFIGRRLVARLLADGRRVRAFVRREPGPDFARDPRVEVVLGDLGDPTAVDRAVAGTELVYHLGAAMKGDADEFHRGTVAGTRNVIDSALRHRVPELVYVSSLSVLHATAPGGENGVTEDWPLEPAPERRGHYTQTKLEAERLVAEAVQARGLPAVILRPGQVFGPGAPVLTPAVARRKGDKLVVLGSGDLVLPLVYVEDVVDALTEAPERPVFDGSVFHLVDPERVTQNELVERYAQSTAERLRVKHLPYPVVWLLALVAQTGFRILGRPAPLSIYRLRSALAQLRFDCGKAKDRLGWRPRVGVRAGLTATLAGLPQGPGPGRG